MLNKRERERKEHKKHIKYYNENNFTVYTCNLEVEYILHSGS